MENNISSESSSTSIPPENVIDYTKTIIDAVNESLEKNTQNFKHSDLQFCKNTFSSIQEIYNDLHNIISSLHISNGSLYITHLDIAQIILSISNIIKKYSTENDFFKKIKNSQEKKVECNGKLKVLTEKESMANTNLSELNVDKLNASSERSVREDQFSSACEGKLKIIRSATNENCKTLEEKEKMNTSTSNPLILVEFIIYVLIDYNIILVPDNLKPHVKIMIKNSIDLLEMNLVLIEEIVEKEKKNCFNFFRKLFFCKNSGILLRFAPENTNFPYPDNENCKITGCSKEN
jgi:hypothetical protein